MINDPLFLKTQQELIKWRAHKKFKGQKITDTIKDQIKLLLEKYPRSEVSKNLEIAASTITTFIKKDSKRAYRKKNFNVIPSDSTPNIFQQITPKIVEKSTSLLKFEIELPGKFMMRLFK